MQLHILKLRSPHNTSKLDAIFGLYAGPFRGRIWIDGFDVGSIIYFKECQAQVFEVNTRCVSKFSE